ncbi:hypothetical protein DFH11DRAFT_1688808 [Phellopilus nigrolimitatus]|nr:hypothetical protein DFH11DRAFT_1688808 [Phellopilus nigrolimitatus]
MLPPLSTLPEEDPVFSLSPPCSRSRSRAYGDSASTSPAISRKASYSSSARSTSSYTYKHTTTPDSRARARHGYGSSAGSNDYAHEYGLTPANSSTRTRSLRSQYSFDSRVGHLGHGRGRGSQGSGVSLMSSESAQSRYDAQRPPTADELSLGLRAYAGNPGQGKFNSAAIPRDCDALLAGWRPYDADAANDFEPGSSSGTLRAGDVQAQAGNSSSRLRSASEGNSAVSVPPVSTLARAHTDRYAGSRARREESSGSDYGGRRRDAPGGGRGGRDDGRDDEDGRRSRKPSSSQSTTSSESETESESDTDDYGQENMFASAPAPKSAAASVPPSPLPAQDPTAGPVFNQLRNGRKGVFRPPTGARAADLSSASTSGEGGSSLQHSASMEDDDVPLAQRIPDALKVQKSIRRQVRDERELRKRDRSVAPSRLARAQDGMLSPPAHQQPPLSDQLERGRATTARPPMGAAFGSGPAALSSSQEAALMAQRGIQPMQNRRPRAKTIGSGSVSMGGVAPDDLTKRLLKVKAQVEPDAHPMAAYGPSSRTSPSRRQPSHTSEELLGAMSLNPPLFERGSTASAALQRSSHSPQLSTQVSHQHSGSGADAPARALRPMRSFHGQYSATTQPAAVSLARRPTSSKGRTSQEHADEHARNKLVKSARTSLDQSGRVSADDYQQQQQQQQHQHRPYPQHQHQHPPVPPLPMPSARAVAAMPAGPTSPQRAAFPAAMAVQTRVYIADMQRFNVVEAGAETNAREQGDLRGEERPSSSWMLYEVCHDLGMERPIRSFELVNDVSGSWPKEKTMNCFMAKRSPLGLSLANIPPSIPKCNGYVDYEYKKGKWNKRWLELREHGLWLSKRENKDDEFLCSLSAFDAYIVTRIQKAPKTFTFAVKSTDPITLFENKSDYLHVFACPEEVGLKWIESIMLARSYILYQEKNVLFRNKNVSAGLPAGPSGGAGLSRAGTRKRPAQTYVSLGSASGFEPGSLLAKRSGA